MTSPPGRVVVWLVFGFVFRGVHIAAHGEQACVHVYTC